MCECVCMCMFLFINNWRSPPAICMCVCICLCVCLCSTLLFCSCTLSLVILFLKVFVRHGVNRLHFSPLQSHKTKTKSLRKTKEKILPIYINKICDCPNERVCVEGYMSVCVCACTWECVVIIFLRCFNCVYRSPKASNRFLKERRN